MVAVVVIVYYSFDLRQHLTQANVNIQPTHRMVLETVFVVSPVEFTPSKD
jgi:hypothetical protein